MAKLTAMPFRSKIALVWSGLTTALLLLNVISFKTAMISYAIGFVWFIEEYMADTEKKLDEIIKRLEALDSQASRQHSV
jgi:hypothetical protein